MSGKFTAVGGIAVLALLGAFSLAVFAQEGSAPDGANGQEEGPKTVAISGRVIDAATGAPIPGAMVSTMETSVTADAEGRFLFPSVPEVRDATLNFRVVTEAGGSVLGCAFIAVPVSLQPISALSSEKFAVKVVETKGDVSGVEIAVKDVTGDLLEKVCEECHRPNPCLAAAKEGGDWTAVTRLGGVEVTEKEFEALKARIQLEGVDPDSYPNLRFQDAHSRRPNAVKAAQEKPDRFKVPDQLVLADGVADCDTCHSLHEPTGFSFFLRMEVDNQSLLCRQCHK